MLPKLVYKLEADDRSADRLSSMQLVDLPSPFNSGTQRRVTGNSHKFVASRLPVREFSPAKVVLNVSYLFAGLNLSLMWTLNELRQMRCSLERLRGLFTCERGVRVQLNSRLCTGKIN